MTEWVIGFLPVPFVVGVVLLALFFGVPRVMLGVYLDTWDFDAVLGLLPQVGGDLLALFLVVDFAVYMAVMLATRYMRRQVVRAKEAILPLLPEGEKTYMRVFGQITRFWPSAAIGAAIAVLFVLLPGEVVVAPSFDFVLGLAVVFLWFPILGAFIWVYLSSTIGLYLLGREALRLTPYTEDPILGLRPLGALSFGLAWPYLAANGIAALWIALGIPGAELMFLIVALVVVGVVLFFVPLYAVHRRMVQERARARAALRSRLPGWTPKVEIPEGESDVTLADVMNRLARLEEGTSLDRAERQINEIYDWPFDTRIVGRLAVLTATDVAVPLALYAVTQVSI